MGDLRDERIVVTGGAGFLGSYLIERLMQMGADDVFVPRSKDYDLVEKEAIARLLEEMKPTLIFHLAGVVGGIGANMREPGSFFYKNAMMGIQLMEQARMSGVKKFVAIGTICSYPKSTPVPFREDSLWYGYPEETNAPYGLAKKMMLVQSVAYRQQYGFNSIFLLPVNLYGPRDNFNPESSHVIPAMIRKFHEAKENGAPSVSLWGDGSATREFLYVDDCAEGIALAAEGYDRSDPVNLGSGKEISIKELSGLIASEIGFRGEVVWDKTRPNGQPRRLLDVTKARDCFGFVAKTDFKEGLRKTIGWYLGNLPQGRRS